MWKSKFYVAFEVDATLDGVAMLVPHRSSSSPRNDLLECTNTLVDFRTGSESRIIAAMDAVADVVKRGKVKGPTIVSMSLGGPCADKDCSFGNDYSKAVSDLRDLGVLTVRRGV